MPAVIELAIAQRNSEKGLKWQCQRFMREFPSLQARLRLAMQIGPRDASRKGHAPLCINIHEVAHNITYNIAPRQPHLLPSSSYHLHSVSSHNRDRCPLLKCCDDQFLQVSHKAPSLFPLFIKDTRPSFPPLRSSQSRPPSYALSLIHI